MTDLDKSIVLDLIVNSEQLLTPNKQGLNDCFFSEYDCHQKILRKKARNLIKKIKFLTDEFLIRDEDYVHFENHLGRGLNTDRIIISKKTDDGFVTLGGFQFITQNKILVVSDCWSGEYSEFKDRSTGKSDGFLGLRTWTEMMKELSYNLRARKQVRNTFFY